MKENSEKKNISRIFLDHASATPVRSEVLEAMNRYSYFANPSALYVEAREAKALMHTARAEVGEFLNCVKERIVFTGGGTEGNNMAILGAFEYARQNLQGNAQGNAETDAQRNSRIAKPHIISILTEHPSVREVLDEVVRRGGEVTLLQPDSDGLISAEQVRATLTPNTILVSVMMVNNEIGVIQPVREIAKIVKKYKEENKTVYPYLHTDACQAALFQTLDVSTLGVDLLTLDGLKIGGPRGCGVLYVRHDVQISPIVFGGGQEGGLRSGTEDVSRMVGMAAALRLAKKERVELAERLEKLRDYFIDKILERFPETHLNGSRKHRVANNVNICFSATPSATFSTTGSHGLDAEYLVVALDTYGVACSYSSSCRILKEDSSSYVVEALENNNENGQHDHDCAHSSLRFTLGRETTQEELDQALVALQRAIEQVKT